MIDTIIKFKSELENNYTNKNNQYELEIKNIEEKRFVELLNIFINEKYKVEKICESKEYINQGNIMNIDINGNMKCKNIKILKYKKTDDNIKISLLNKRDIQVDYFNFYKGIESYDKKEMIIKNKNYELNFIIKSTKNVTAKKQEDKVIINYEIKLLFKEIDNNVKNILEKLH